MPLTASTEVHIKVLKKDKLLFAAIKSQEPYVLLPKNKVYLSLVASIISQQLSTKVATVIYSRFLKLYGTKLPTTSMILATDLEQLRSIGLSNAKANYVLNVCRFFEENSLKDETIQKMDDESVINLLIQIKGVGRWTAEMILMFTLGREDVFALDDLGIQQGMTKIYDLDISNKKQLAADMILISNRWKPYRTYACRYIWNYKDFPKDQ